MMITFEGFSLVWSGDCHGISYQSISVLFLRRKRRRRTDIESMMEKNKIAFSEENSMDV